MPERKTLQCAVVGAGIAGLGAAIALRRAGHDVEIFERSTFSHEVGAAITMTPNANLILDHWGFDAVKAAETAKCQFRRIKWDTLDLEYRDSFSGVHGRYGHMFNAFHRVDLHNGLRELAGEQMSVEIKLASRISRVNCDLGTLTLADGMTLQKDLIVLADGVKVSLLTTLSRCTNIALKSPFVADVAGKDVPLTKTGRSIFRTLIPIDRIM